MSSFGKEIDENRLWDAHRRFQLEEDLRRDFGPAAGGENVSGSLSTQRERAERLAEHIISHPKIPAESYFFQGSSSRSTFLTVSHSQLSDFDVVLLCDRQWLLQRKEDSFRDLAEVLQERVVSNVSRKDLHYTGRNLDIPEHKFTFVEGRCGVELRVSVDHPWCEAEATDFVLAYRDETQPGSIVVFDHWLNTWRKNNPVRVAASVNEVEEQQPYYGMVVRMLKEWNQHCPRLRKVRTGSAIGQVTVLDDELPPEFGGPGDVIVLHSLEDSELVHLPSSKFKPPMTGLHIEMALCLQHDGFKDTFWAKQLTSKKNLQTRTENLLVKEPETPCAIDLLVGAVVHLMTTLSVPIWTPGDEAFANEAILKDAELRQQTEDLLRELLLELQKVQREPNTPDATGCLLRLPDGAQRDRQDPASPAFGFCLAPSNASGPDGLTMTRAMSKDIRSIVPFAIGILFFVIYFTVLLVRFEDTLMAPPTQRVARDVSVVRLPRLYFCPANRFKQAHMIWSSYECSLSYKLENDLCNARLQRYGGDEPQVFRHGANWSSACLEFGTHRIGVKQEYSAAWNEISLKAAFLLPDVFEEVELGYLPREWEVGEAPSKEHYYAPLIRVPLFKPNSLSKPSPGVVTRMYLAEEEDHGRHEAGDYWYATVPEQSFLSSSPGEWAKAPQSRRGIAHVVITLEDFTKYEYRVQPVIYPLLSLFSQLSGVAALFCWAFFKGPMLSRKILDVVEEDPKSSEQGPETRSPRRSGQRATRYEGEYRSIADADEEEQQSLLEVDGRGGAPQSSSWLIQMSELPPQEKVLAVKAIPEEMEVCPVDVEDFTGPNHATVGNIVSHHALPPAPVHFLEEAYEVPQPKLLKHSASTPGGMAEKIIEDGSVTMSSDIIYSSAKRGSTMPSGFTETTAISRSRHKRVREFWSQTEPAPIETTAIQTDPVKFETKKGRRIVPEAQKKPQKPRKDGGHNRVFQDAEALKQKARQDRVKPQYNVFDYYHKKGCAQYLAKHWLLEYITLFVVCLNTIWIAIDTDLNNAAIITAADLQFQIAENFFCAYFFGELLIRFLAFANKRHCLQDYWFNFDLLLVTLMVAETWIVPLIFNLLRLNEQDLANAVNIDFLRVLRLVRILRLSRMAKLLRAVPELVIIIKGIGFAARSVLVFFLLWTMIIYVFAIVLRQTTAGYDFGTKRFSTVSHAMVTLFLSGIVPGQADLVDEAGYAHWAFWLILVFFVLLASVTIMYMLVGVLVEVMTVISSTEKEGMTVSYVATSLRAIMHQLNYSTEVPLSQREFQQLLREEEVDRLLRDIGVDVVALADTAEVIYEDFSKHGMSMDFTNLMDTILNLRGKNTATVKDVKEQSRVIKSVVQQTLQSNGSKVMEEFQILRAELALLREEALRRDEEDEEDEALLPLEMEGFKWMRQANFQLDLPPRAAMKNGKMPSSHPIPMSSEEVSVAEWVIHPRGAADGSC
eukprot:s574_g35.t1